VAAGAAAALAVALGASPASAAAVAERHLHSFTARSGARVTCSVIVQQSWLEDEATVSTELTGPAACRAREVVVRWRFVDAAGAVHKGREEVVGGQRASATLHGVAADLSSAHRVELADCADDCTFGPHVFTPFSSK
jgi:hypothetical protein